MGIWDFFGQYSYFFVPLGDTKLYSKISVFTKNIKEYT